MKNLLAIACFCFCSLTAWGQHETIFNKARVVGGFVSPLVEFGLNNNLHTSYGAGGGIVINNVFIGGYGLAGFDLKNAIDNEDLETIDIAHGGIWIGGTYQPHKLVHIYGTSRIGWGTVNIDVNDNNLEYRDLDKIFVVTPEIGAEINITKWFRVGATAGYRFVNGVDKSTGFSDDDFRGAVSTLSFRFGWFGKFRN